MATMSLPSDFGRSVCNALLGGTAADRLEWALRSKARTSGESLDVKPGDMVDIWRPPYTKDCSGWLGPEKVVNVTEIANGNVDVKWQGHIYSMSVRHIRRALNFMVLLNESLVTEMNTLETIWKAVQYQIKLLEPGMLLILAAMVTQQGWQLTASATRFHRLFMSLLYGAFVSLGVPNCIGARIGNGIEVFARV